VTVPVRTPPARRPRTGGRRHGLVAAGAALTLLAIAGCSGGASSSSAGSASSAALGSAVDGAGTGSSAAPSIETKDGSSTTSGSQVGAPLAVISDRSIVVHADVAIQVGDVLKATAALGTLATGHSATIASQSTSAGSTTVSPDVQTNPDGTRSCPSTGCPTSYASSTTTLRVANSEVDALLADVAKLGTAVSATRTSEDVTADVADVEARVRNAQASLARIRALMAQATKIGDVVALEGELSRRQSDLEAIEARQRALADQTAQATVTVRLLGSSAPAPTPATDETGFVAGLKAGWDSFTTFTAGTLTVVGALVPWLIVLVPAALIGAAVVRRRRTSPDVVDQAG